MFLICCVQTSMMYGTILLHLSKMLNYIATTIMIRTCVRLYKFSSPRESLHYNPAQKYEVWIWKFSSKLKMNFKECRDATDTEIKQSAKSIFHLSIVSWPLSLNISSSPFDQTGQKTALFQKEQNAAKQRSQLASTSIIDFSPNCDHSLFVTFSCRLFNTPQPNQFHIFVKDSMSQMGRDVA